MAGAVPPTGLVNQTSNAAPSRAVSTPAIAAPVSPDSVQIGGDKAVFDVSLQVDPKLFVKDASGHAPIEHMHVALVPDDQASPSDPQVLSAELEKPAPDGRVNVPTVIAVDKGLVDSGAIRSYHSYVVGPDQQILSNSDIQAIQKKATDKALPAGFQRVIAPSLGGDLARQGSNLGEKVIGTTSGYFSALALSGAMGIPAALAGPAALVAAPIQMFGSNGWLHQLGTTEDSKQYIDTQSQLGKTALPMQVAPGGKLVGSYDEQSVDRLRGDLNTQVKTIQGNMAGTGLLAGAGLAASVSAAATHSVFELPALVGGAHATLALGAAAAAAAPLLATGAIVVPMAAGLYSTYHQLQDLKADEAHLVDLQSQGATTTPKNVPVVENGKVVALRQVDVPIADQLASIQKSKKVKSLAMTAEASVGGAMAAVALGAPALLGTLALAIPAAVAIALFPKESLELLESLPGKLVDATKAVGHWVSEKASSIFGGKPNQPAAEAAPPQTDADKAYVDALAQVKALDPALSDRIEKGLRTLFGAGDNQSAEDVKAAVDDSNAALAQLRQKNPDLFQKLVQAHQGVMAEMQAQAVEQLSAAVDKAVKSPKAQAVLQSAGVQSIITKDQISERDAEGAMGAILRAGLTHDPTELDELQAKAQSGDPQAQSITELVQSINQAFIDQQQAQAAPATN